MNPEYMTKAERERDAWATVEAAVRVAHLVAWDGCHKIYLAMDEPKAEWFATHYEETSRGHWGDMLTLVRDWFSRSCSLRFVNSVTTNLDDPNAGYLSLIPQGFDEYRDPCAFCGYSDCDGFECDEVTA